MSHEAIINKYITTVRKVKLEEQDFVRLEIVPSEKNNITRNKVDWNYKVDDTGILPQWYHENVEKIETLAWLEWQKSIKINLALGTEIVEATDRFLIAYGKARIVGHDSSSMVGHDSSCGYLYSGRFIILSKTAVVIDSNTGKIIVSKEAEVVVQEAKEK